jgi:hypothetical protein
MLFSIVLFLTVECTWSHNIHSIPRRIFELKSGEIIGENG